jgi:hypothetical protein
MAKKTALVQPKPAIPDHLKLIKALELIGNDRAYTTISQKGNTWEIQFEGDEHSTVITFEGEKTKII